MSLNIFQQLPSFIQLYWVLKHGIYLTQREATPGLVRLYLVIDGAAGFLVEVSVKEDLGRGIVLRSFARNELLEGYTEGVPLSE
ncbi:hypothetical protein [Hymenobacter sp. BT559]|uniref:hypothetical protein n=1 Tax=Hymenobacter sp. BT559 TaxID=2795729 RepID=UPI0018EDA6D7|nr:hypothetical protein [Hymenobacter sp. BT559]MBJ6141756.1 hypothetical protein [Hymenobacter sp. BT559]